MEEARPTPPISMPHERYSRRASTVATHLSEARRAALLSSQQVLETIAQMNEVERQKHDYERQLQQIDTQARIDVLDKLQQSVLHMAELRSTLKGINARLALVGNLHTDPTVHPAISVFRKDGDNSVHVAAAPDLELAPGDVVEVTLPQDATSSLHADVPPMH